jgi:hypothetical protein
MPRRSRNLGIRHLLWVALGFFCCALITLGGIIQAGHTHADGQAIQSDCALCQVAHLVVQPSVPQSLPRIVRIVAAIPPAPQPIRSKPFSVFSLFTRPPPARTAHS